MNDTQILGTHKAALLLLAMDEDTAASVMRHMEEPELRKLADSASQIDGRMVNALESTFEDFEHQMTQQVIMPLGEATSYLKGIAARAFGPQKADEMLSMPQNITQPMDAIRSARAQTLAELLQEENPQVAAVIVSQLPRSQAAAVINTMPEEARIELLGRIASLKEIPRETVEIASQALAKSLEAAGALQEGTSNKSFDGVSFAAGILNELPSSDSEKVLSEMQERYGKVTPKIRQAMFTFEDLMRLEVRAIQVLMREVSSEQILVALKTASEGLRDKFLSAVSSRAADAMRDDLAVMPPMRLSEVENAQREVVEAALRLAGDGRIVLPGSSEDKMV